MKPLSILIASFLGAALPAQLPSGYFVASTMSTSLSNPGGLWLVHPTIPGPAAPITGLPSELTAGNPLAANTGANCVSYNPADGTLLVGENGIAGETIDIHQIYVSGGAVVLDIKTPVGVGTTSNSSIMQISPLANGDAIFTVTNLAIGPPLNGSSFGYYDRALNTVTPLPVPPWSFINGMVVDEAAGVIYFAQWQPSELWSVPITGGTPTLITPINTSMYNLGLDEDRNILISTNQTITAVDPTGQTVYVENLPGYSNGVSIERATATVVSTVQPTVQDQHVYRLDPGGPTALAMNVPGLMSGITVVNSEVEYGAPTPGTIEYEFQTFPGVGGLPIAGNLNHAVQVNSTNGAGAPGIIAFSFGAASFPALGVQVLVDPTTAVPFGLYTPNAPLAVPIPAGTPSTTMFLQAFHLDTGNPGGVASTRGMAISTIE